MDATRLFVEMDTEIDLEATLPPCALADGIVVPAALDPDAIAHTGAGRCLVADCTEDDAPRWASRETVAWIACSGLEASVRLRDRWPAVSWLPRARVHRPASRFDFRPSDHGEGFKTYAPDLVSYRRHRVAGDDVDLRDWLDRARALGFDAVWLHGIDRVQASGHGLDLDMLERASGCFTGQLWISGGATGPAHLANLVAQGGAHAVVVRAAVALEHGVPALDAALRPPLPVTAQAPPPGVSCGVQPVSSDRA